MLTTIASHTNKSQLQEIGFVSVKLFFSVSLCLPPWPPCQNPPPRALTRFPKIGFVPSFPASPAALDTAPNHSRRLHKPNWVTQNWLRFASFCVAPAGHALPAMRVQKAAAAETRRPTGVGIRFPARDAARRPLVGVGRGREVESLEQRNHSRAAANAIELGVESKRNQVRLMLGERLLQPPDHGVLLVSMPDNAAKAATSKAGTASEWSFACNSR